MTIKAWLLVGLCLLLACASVAQGQDSSTGDGGVVPPPLGTDTGSASTGTDDGGGSASTAPTDDGSGSSSTASTDEGSSSSGADNSSSTGAAPAGTDTPLNAANDLKVVSFALTFENAGVAFYEQFLGTNFTDSNFTDAGYPNNTYAYFQLIQQHEMAHADVFTQIITGRGGSPVPPCNYTFNVTTIQEFVAYAALLENVGVSAYVGAFNTLSDPQLQASAATIATVEARHASFLNELIGASPFPNITEPALTTLQVVALLAPAITSCSYEWNDPANLPVIRPNGASYVSFDSPPPSANSSAAQVAGTYTAEQAANDAAVLRYALTLERLEAAFYTEALNQDNLQRTDFENAGYATGVYDEVLLIRAHEQAHEAALTLVLQGRNESLPPNCTYNFTAAFTDVATFLVTAGELEATGVSAYDGAGAGLTDTFLSELAASVATVEARHSTFLNRLNGFLPFNASTDTPLPPADVLTQASAFIGECDGNITADLPDVIAPGSPAPYINYTELGLNNNASAQCSITTLTVSGCDSLTFTTDSSSYTCAAAAADATLTVSGQSAQNGVSITVDGGDPQAVTDGTAIIPANSNTVVLTVTQGSAVLALGDSVTFGATDLVYANGSTPTGYPTAVADYIDSVNGAEPPPTVTNLAISGETAASFFTGAGRVPSVANRTDALLAAQNAYYFNSNTSTPQAEAFTSTVNQLNTNNLLVQAVFISLGFSDLAALALPTGAGAAAITQALSDYRANYRAILRQVRAQLPSADIYLLGTYNPFPADPTNPAGPIFAAGAPVLNSIINELAVEFGGVYVDLTAAFTGNEATYTYIAQEPAGSELNDSVTANGGVLPLGNTNPNADGYQAIVNAIIAAWSSNTTYAACAQSWTITFGDQSGSSTGTDDNGNGGATGDNGTGDNGGASGGADDSTGDDNGGAGGGSDDSTGDDNGGAGGGGADDSTGDDNGGAGGGSDDSTGDDNGGAGGGSDDSTGDDNGGDGGPNGGATDDSSTGDDTGNLNAGNGNVALDDGAAPHAASGSMAVLLLLAIAHMAMHN